MYAETAIISIVLTLILGWFLIPALRWLKAGQSIREDGPIWHAGKAGTPTMGGMMFIIGGGLALLITGLRIDLHGNINHWYVFGFALIFGLIGFIDDFYKVKYHRNEGLTARQKFLLQLAVAIGFLTLMRYEGLLTNDLYIPFFNRSFTLPWVVYLIFAAFVIIGCVNSVNLTDGIDGLAGSVTLFVMIFFTITAAMLAQRPAIALFAVAMAGGLGGFLVYNSYPAKVFMGDTGSLFLGGAVAALAFALDLPLVLIPVGLVYIWETLSDIIQVIYFKKTHGKRFFKMAPFHHHLEKCGWSERKIVTVFSLITMIGCTLAYVGIIARY